MVVRFITKRYIGEYDPTLEKVYTYHATIDNEMVYFDILDTAGQPHVSLDVMKCEMWRTKRELLDTTFMLWATRKSRYFRKSSSNTCLSTSFLSFELYVNSS